MSEWISTEDRPPEFPCFVIDGNYNYPEFSHGLVRITVDGKTLYFTGDRVGFDGKGRWLDETNKKLGRYALSEQNSIIYWMPIPPLPEGSTSLRLKMFNDFITRKGIEDEID